MAQPSLEELYAVAADSPAPRTPDRRSLRDWASNQLEEASDQQHVLLLPPGEHQFGSDWGPWLVSSSNIAGAAPGEELLGPAKLNIRGQVPARLLAKSAATPPMESPSVMVLSPDSGDIEPVRRPKPSCWSLIGRKAPPPSWWWSVSRMLWRIGTAVWLMTAAFLTSKVKGPWGFPWPCCGCWPASSTCPFRKDVLQRILEDQLNRNEDGAGISLLQMAAIADVMGLRASQLNVDDQQIARLQFPAITMGPYGPLILWDSDQGGQVLVGDPTAEQALRPIASLEERDEEGLLTVLCIERSQQTPTKRFGISWFLPALKQYKSVLIQVLLASFFVQLFGLLNPLLIQQIIDAVISQGNVSTLNVLGTLLVGMGLAQAVLSSLRTYLFSDTTNRIDISLGSTIIDHLLRLPLGYFADRPVGEVSSRLNELEKIRRFLTGTALTVILDAVFAVIYIAVMLLYSVQLTFWALAVVPSVCGRHLLLCSCDPQAAQAAGGGQFQSAKPLGGNPWRDGNHQGPKHGGA